MLSSILHHSIFSRFFFFFNDTATTEIYTLSLHDALPICDGPRAPVRPARPRQDDAVAHHRRSEEHTSELQSLAYLVCRLLLEKKKNFECQLRIEIKRIKIIIREFSYR